MGGRTATSRELRCSVLSALLFGACLAVTATIVDRIAITAGSQVITDSEIDQRIRLTAFENHDQPSLDLAARKTAADRLIDEKLIEHEMDVGHYPRLNPDERGNLVADKPGLDSSLAAYGLTRAELEADLAKQADLLTFVSVRFRPAVQMTDADIRKFFQTEIQPKLPPGDTRGMEDFRSQIETKLTGDMADRDMDTWLKEQRKRTKIQYLEKDLAP